jgi:hypothetical protein
MRPLETSFSNSTKYSYTGKEPRTYSSKEQEEPGIYLVKPLVLRNRNPELCNAGMHPIIAPEQFRIPTHKKRHEHQIEFLQKNTPLLLFQ